MLEINVQDNPYVSYCIDSEHLMFQTNRLDGRNTWNRFLFFGESVVRKKNSTTTMTLGDIDERFHVKQCIVYNHLTDTREFITRTVGL